jgi:hypothetical protein
MKRLSVVAVVVLGLVSIPCRVVAVQDADTAVIINMEPGQVMLEFVGQMVDVPTTALPSSSQFGFLSFIRGLKALFMTDSPPFDRTTAKFGFSTRATTTREIANGPLVVITREGVTRISFTPCPLCLSPSVGTINPSLSIPVFLIQTSTLRQQVIIDNDTRSFTVVNINTITETRPFDLGGRQFQLGKVDKSSERLCPASWIPFVKPRVTSRATPSASRTLLMASHPCRRFYSFTLMLTAFALVESI